MQHLADLATAQKIPGIEIYQVGKISTLSQVYGGKIYGGERNLTKLIFL